MKLSELTEDGSLDGFKNETCYILQLTHGLAGFFPALINGPEGEDRFIVCTDKAVLEDVRALLDKKRKRKSHITDHQMLLHVEKQLAFDKGLDDPEDLPVLTRDKFDCLVAENEEPFRWAPGLLSFVD